MNVWRRKLTEIVLIVFEGAAHPYKENLIRLDGKTSIIDTLGVELNLLKETA